LLVKANQLFSRGEYLKSAKIFEKLAEEVFSRGGPRAPQLFIQAGRAQLFAGQVDTGMVLVKKGLNQLFIEERWPQLRRLGRRAFAVLEELRYFEQAKELRSWLAESLPAKSEGEIEAFSELRTRAKSRQRPVLPVACPSCGGGVHSDEVEWVNEQKAECSFCGNLILTE
jgi:hypothetical protein